MLTVKEFKEAKEYWWCTVQVQTFRDEMATLEQRGSVKRSSKLMPFHPFLDPQGLVQVGGRVNQAELSYSKRHSILLLGDHILTKVIVISEHKHLLYYMQVLRW